MALIFRGSVSKLTFAPREKRKRGSRPGRARRRGLPRPRGWRRGRAEGYRQLARPDAKLPASLERNGFRVFDPGSGAGSRRA